MLLNACLYRNFLQIAKKACLVRVVSIFLAATGVGMVTSHGSSASDTLRLAVDIWFPYENISNKEMPGFSTEVVFAVLTDLGIAHTIHEAP